MQLPWHINKLTLEFFLAHIHNDDQQVDKLIYYLKHASIEDIVATVCLNDRSEKYKNSLLEQIISVSKYQALLKIILERIPGHYLDFSNMKYYKLKKLVTLLIKDKSSFYLDKLKNTPSFDLNAICDPYYQTTVLSEIVRATERNVDVLLKILATFSLEKVNFNAAEKNTLNKDTLLFKLFSIAVSKNKPHIIDIILNSVPFRHLDFTNASVKAWPPTSENMIQWLNTTEFRDYIPKIIESAITQGKIFWDRLIHTADQDGNVDEVQNKIFEDHLEKIKLFAEHSQSITCATRLEELQDYRNAKIYELHSDVENLEILANKISTVHRFYEEIYNILAESIAFSMHITEKPIELDPKAHEKQLLRALNCMLDASRDAELKKHIALTYVFRSLNGGIPSAEKGTLIQLITKTKIPVSESGKKT
ncbi:MAG TPA: hypothetical protein VFP93_04375, partial [Gammaproteobacteria bacterium]|nr:hypothetical protein [Gammaproteobacteria bacterium]